MKKNLSSAIEFGEVTVKSWESLGEYLAQAASDDQAQFILGFWSACYDSQLAHIGADPEFGPHGDHAREEVADFLTMLAEKIKDGGKR